MLGHLKFSSNRVIAIDKFLEEDLLELKSYYKEKYKLDMDFYIFGGVKPLSPSTINRRKLKACEKQRLDQLLYINLDIVMQHC